MPDEPIAADARSALGPGHDHVDIVAAAL